MIPQMIFQWWKKPICCLGSTDNKHASQLQPDVLKEGGSSTKKNHDTRATTSFYKAMINKWDTTILWQGVDFRNPLASSCGGVGGNPKLIFGFKHWF